MTTDERPGITERYARAIESSHLEPEAERRCDVDILIAAGWVKEGLGTTLLRARIEFDGLNKRELALAADSLTARVYTLASMPTLPKVRNMLGDYAVVLATRRSFMAPDAAVLTIAGRALDLWLDPSCHHCDGRGFSGGYQAPMVMCGHCHSSGRRTLHFGPRGEEGHQFGRLLMNEMDRKTQYVERRMRDFLKDWKP
jgi:hypothetical protein